MRLTKQQAYDIFGGKRQLERLVGRQAVWRWPELLSESVTERVIGVAVLNGYDVSKYRVPLRGRLA